MYIQAVGIEAPCTLKSHAAYVDKECDTEEGVKPVGGQHCVAEPVVPAHSSRPVPVGARSFAHQQQPAATILYVSSFVLHCALHSRVLQVGAVRAPHHPRLC